MPRGDDAQLPSCLGAMAGLLFSTRKALEEDGPTAFHILSFLALSPLLRPDSRDIVSCCCCCTCSIPPCPALKATLSLTRTNFSILSIFCDIRAAEPSSL